MSVVMLLIPPRALLIQPLQLMALYAVRVLQLLYRCVTWSPSLLG